MKPILIEKPDYYLRLPTKDDVLDFYKIVSDKYLDIGDWSVFIQELTTPAKVHDFINQNQEAFERLLVFDDKRIHPGFQMLLTKENQIIGICGFQGIHLVNRIATIGYWLITEMRGKGLATKAARALLKYGSEVLLIHRFEIQCRSDNKSSIKLAERLGFTKEGTLRGYEFDEFANTYIDHELYSYIINS